MVTVMHASSLLITSLKSSLISWDSDYNIPTSLLQHPFKMSLMQVIMLIFNRYGPIIPMPKKKWESSDHFLVLYCVMTIDISRVEDKTTQSIDFHYYEQEQDKHISSNIPNLFYIILHYITLNWYLDNMSDFMHNHTDCTKGPYLLANIEGYKEQMYLSGNKRGILKKPRRFGLLN
jgi:hypothetical protein